MVTLFISIMLNCSLVSYMVYRWLFLHLFSLVAESYEASAVAMYDRTVEIPSDWALEQPGVEFSISGYYKCENEELCVGNYFSVEEEQGKMILKLGSVDCTDLFLVVTVESKLYILFHLKCEYA